MIGRRRVLLFVASMFLMSSAAHAQLVFPHYAQGGGYQTTFTVTNLTSSTAVVNISLHDPGAASPGAVYQRRLAPDGTDKVSLTGNTLTVGWADIAAQSGGSISAVETIQIVNGTTVLAEASVLPSTPDAMLRLPVTEKDNVATGIAIANTGTASATLTLILRNQDGSPAGTRTVSLGPSGQMARFVSELFSGISAFEGSLEVSSTVPVAGIAIRQLQSGLFSTLPVSGASPLETFFSPSGGIAARIVQQIQRSQTSIDIAIYSFTRNEIADAVIAAKNRGVAVRIIADSEQAPGVGSDIARLEAAGVPLKRTAGRNGGIMHNKYAIFDGQVLLTGSYNWSTSAEENNFENAIFMRDPQTIASYQGNFNSIWNTR